MPLTGVASLSADWHAFLGVQYKNVRPDYLKNIWKVRASPVPACACSKAILSSEQDHIATSAATQVVNWKNVAERLEAAK